MARRHYLLAAFLTYVASAVGCAEDRVRNPSFQLTMPQARRVLAQMHRERKPLQRPVVVVTGYLDPGMGTAYLVPQIREVATDARAIGVSFLFDLDFDSCRRRLIAQVDEAFPTSDPERTTEVDVIAVSMGGIVARYAAMPIEGGPPGEKPRRLRIARLFTISSPHRGANLADWPSLNPLHLDMRASSEFMHRLNAALATAGFPIYPYVRLNDVIVGPANAAPAGTTAWWVDNPPFQPSHVATATDPRIRADIFRRLRNEPPFTASPPAPLPDDAGPTSLSWGK